jgi:hypothetical protein
MIGRVRLCAHGIKHLTLEAPRRGSEDNIQDLLVRKAVASQILDVLMTHLVRVERHLLCKRHRIFGIFVRRGGVVGQTRHVLP